MIPTPTQPTGSHRRKLSIEIYFVLYLSAIVLLMGTATTSKHEDPDDLIRTLREFMVDFNVEVEKVALVYTMLPAGLEVLPASEKLRKDSMNVVHAWGSVRNIDFDIIGIRDTTDGRMLPIESATLENIGGNRASVRWKPNVAMKNRVYAISIAASADPEVPPTIPAASRARVAAALQSEGRVRDTVTFTVSVFAVTNPNMVHAVVAQQQRIADTPSSTLLASASPALLPPVAGSSFSIEPGQDHLRVAAGQEWRTKLVFNGITNVDAEIEQLTFDPPTVRRERTSGGTVYLVGGAITTGERTITASARRRADGRVATASFTISAGKLTEPSIPRDLYSGESYTLNFGADDVPSSLISVRVKENGKVVIDNGPSVISYRPRSLGAATFERFVDGRIAGTYEATVSALPFPVFTGHTAEADDRGLITTKSYGMYEGRPNKVVLKVLDGNVADEPEEVDYRYDEKTKTHIQRWRVWRQSADKEFILTAWAMDRRGSGSATKKRMKLEFDR